MVKTFASGAEVPLVARARNPVRAEVEATLTILQNVYFFILCLYIYALSHTQYKIMYIYQPTVSWRKDILLYFCKFVYIEKRMHFVRQRKGRGTSNQTN